MSPGTRERRLVESEAPSNDSAAAIATELASESTVSAALRRRRGASYRCAPLVCGRRDPLDPLGDRGRSTFGLTTYELRAEANRLAELGWALDEVTARLAVVLQRQVVA